MKYLVILTIACLFGCAGKPTTQYFWGNYEDLIYSSYNKPGEMDTPTQISLLEEDIQKADAAGKPLPPGFYAHLGYLYILAGNLSQSSAAFETEKQRFKESELFVNKITANISQAQAKAETEAKE